jgi:hypothetical protein
MKGLWLRSGDFGAVPADGKWVYNETYRTAL